MAYEIEYVGTNAEKSVKALQDCRNYLGTKQYNKIIKAIAQGFAGNTTRQYYRSIRFQLAIIVGIQGYPARAMLREAFNQYKSEL